MRGHGVQAEACLVIPSQIHNVCAISVLNLIHRRVKRSTPVVIWVKTDIKTFACPFVDNVCNSLVAHGRTSSLIPCNTKLYYCSISEPSFVFVLKEFLNTPKSSLFLNLFVAIKCYNSRMSPGICPCPTLCNKLFYGCSNSWTVLKYSAHLLAASSLKESLFHYLPS